MIVRGILCIISILFFCSCQQNSKTGIPSKEAEQLHSDTLNGLLLSKKYCASCHLRPDPKELAQKQWATVLPIMGHYMGIYDDTTRISLLEKGLGGEIVEKANIFPTNQTISTNHWERLKKYYLDSAANNVFFPQDTVIIANTLPLFTVLRSKFKLSAPSITSLIFNQKTQHYLMADYKPAYSTLNILDADFNSEYTSAIESPISDIDIKNDTIYLTLIGNFFPSDEPIGKLIKVYRSKGSLAYNGTETILESLQRPVMTQFTDLDDDGLDDILVCEFGRYVGGLNWYKSEKNHTFTKRSLMDKPGFIHTEIADMNGDGKKEVIALKAQGDEGIYIFYNEGKGSFKTEKALQFSALNGSVFFELYDFNTDGFLDIIYSNGDNADYSKALKPYHGVHIFLNDGSNNFKEAYFYPMHGAYKTASFDFDEDGDVDIAAISFFSDLKRESNAGFIFLENRSTSHAISFKSLTFPDADIGRWLVMDVADIDNDTDTDIILGSFSGMGTFEDSLNLKRSWEMSKLPFVALINQTH